MFELLALTALIYLFLNRKKKARKPRTLDAELRALIGSLGQAAPRQSTHDLRVALDALLEDWRPLVQAGLEDEDVRKAAPEQFLEELEDPRWGQFSLNASRWLLARTWTADRNVRGNRQGAAQITNWLPRLLADDAVALQLPRYQQQPEDLAEQLPRIERIQAWLHHARQVLESPDLDRLFGELNKLHELANLPIGDEVLSAFEPHGLIGLALQFRSGADGQICDL